MPGQEALQEDLFPNPERGGESDKSAAELEPLQVETSRSSIRYCPSSAEVWLAGFILFNLVLSELLFLTPLYHRYETHLRDVLLYFSFLMLIGVSALSSTRLFDYASGQLRSGRWVAELNAALGLLLLSAYFAYGFIFDREKLLAQPLSNSLLISFALFLFFEKGLAYISGNLAKVGVGMLPSKSAPHTKGDELTLTTGDVAPCDGEVLSGDAECRELRFSPLPVLRIKRKGETVYGGSTIVSGRISLKVQGPGSESPISWFIQKFKNGIQPIDMRALNRGRLVLLWNLACFAGALIGSQLLLSSGGTFDQVVRFSSAILFLSLFSHLLYWDAALLKALAGRLFEAGILMRDYSALTRIGEIDALVVDHSRGIPISSSVSDIQILDDSVDRNSLLRAVISVLSHSDEPLYLEVASLCRDRLNEPLGVLAVENYREYEKMGACALVSGAQFSLGSEEFMLARGVELQSSDLVAADQEGDALLVALETNVVARIIIGSSDRESEAVSALRNHGVRTVLLSAEKVELADAAGKKLGLELSNIYGGLTEELFREKLSKLERSAIITSGKISPELPKLSSLVIAPFDELLWDTESADVTVFSLQLSKIASVFKTAREVPLVLNAGWILLMVTPVTLAVSLYLGLFGPVQVLVTVSLLTLLLASAAQRLFPPVTRSRNS